MCRNNPPEKYASKIRRGNLPDLCATLTRWIYSPRKGATSTRGFCLPENPPSRLRIPRQDPARHPSPPPSNSANGGGGRGQGTDPARPCILNRYSYFHSLLHEWLHILIWHNTYEFYTERTINESITILLQEKELFARKGWGANLLPPH